ncbi:MAG: AAA family ATPase [Syntrophales bacterium]|nr:AAA family ATPase [Syntrophales bacterium]
MEQKQIVDALTNRYLVPFSAEERRLIQTHISYLLILGNEVYKIKKPVDFGFLDFTTLEKRKFFCEEELRLNRRLAPHIYLDVTPITLDERGRISLGEEGKIVEYAVHMKRLPEEGMLKRLIANPEFDSRIIDRIAHLLAQFHLQAETGGKVDEMGAPDVIRYNHEENFAQTKKYIGQTISADQYASIEKYSLSFLEDREAYFWERIKNHRIRDCHGDLHLEHICVSDEITIFDCIEFNERFRFSDVAAEVAFLAMDFDFNGYPAYAEQFVEAYMEFSQDQGVRVLHDFYRCYYAYVRGKVISFRLDDSAIREEERRQAEKIARRYFALSHRYATGRRTPVLMTMVGLTGTGKTFVAQELARRLGAQLIQTDVIRKELAGLPPEEHRYEPFGEGIYSPEMSRRTYEEARRRAEEALRKGKSVILDATHTRDSEREEALKIARRYGASFYLLNCHCPEETVKTRLSERLGRVGEASDGRWEIYLKQREKMDPLTPWSEFLISIDTSQPRDAIMNEIFTSLV